MSSTSSTTRTAGRQATADRPSGSASSGATQPAGSTEELEPGVHRTVLTSGLRVVTEQMPGVRSAAIGVWVGVGSRDENAATDTASTHGCSHFLEHLLFKGTSERSALDISVALDAVGGEFNAFTAKEYTCFHARVLDEDLELAVDIIGDMITSSLLTDEDVEAERDVILDEIAMHDDDPDDVVHNLFAAQAWGEDTPLGRGIAGTVESIEALTRDQIEAFYREHYRPENIVISAAGNLAHGTVVALVERAFARNGFLAGVAAPVPPRTGEPLRVAPGEVRATRPFEQVNVVLGMEGLRRDDDRRFALGIVNAALGGGTSSRLFQEVREHRGLAYSVYSFAGAHAESGLVGVAVGCLPSKVEEVLDVVRQELRALAAEGITAEEVARGKGQLRGGLVLGLEDPASRMSRLGKAELVHDELLTIDQVLDRISSVTVEECRDVAAEIFSRPEILAIVGPR
ncbi:pitrilysin family protein [Nocardioides sp. BP30]|uniref:M16 family metallopeptidase n=1 Tax=Nocardioides sp. BP30 TaxID=3036374 RepID=UPI002469AB2F|nr:pitrilysin family protein [Nocardioides sp. BP30]WGL53766.1 pitrilysin family protein [Nocardioides sp. BP30]